MSSLMRLADRRPHALAALAFATGVTALVISVPPITEAATRPTYVDPAASYAEGPQR